MDCRKIYQGGRPEHKIGEGQHGGERASLTHADYTHWSTLQNPLIKLCVSCGKIIRRTWRRQKDSEK
jgi:hypothetical protein